MPSKNALMILEVLERRGQVKEEGKGWRTRCPNPDHTDRRPSFFLYPGGGGKCFSRCLQYWPPSELSAFLGISLPHWDKGLTLAQLVEAKSIPEEFLGSLGVANGLAGAGQSRRPCVDIPYSDERGEVVAVRKRLRLEGHSRFVWRRNDRTTLYGLPYLEEIRRLGWVILVEGETDCWTLWHCRVPALGVPGVSNWRREFASYLDGLDVYLWHELDGGGDRLVKAVSSNLPDVRLMNSLDGAKDPSELYLQVGEGFKQTIEELIRAARPMSELRALAFTEEARESLVAAKELLDSPELLPTLKEDIARSGYAGDPRPAIMTYVAVTSRLGMGPLNLAYIAQSASGKNAAVDAALPFFPGSAFYLVRASSPRALIYNDESFTHRSVILTEADSLPEDGPAASAMRSLMSDAEMSYEVTEKGEDGSHITRKIVKPGPTGLITTSTKPLGLQASTRTLTVTISDSPDQTRLVLHAQADRINQDVPAQDLGRWIALQRWLELAGTRDVVIPFAHALADLVPDNAVRMRRDFPQMLSVIQAIAMLYQRQRRRDSQGRIIATLEDYSMARSLLEEVFTTTVQEGVTPAIRGTVEAVARLSPDGSPVLQRQLVDKLRLSKSTVHYRVERALQGGWLVNQCTVKGAPAQLVPGEPLPDGNPLPHPDQVAVCGDGNRNPSNRRTVPEGTNAGQASSRGSNMSATEFEPNAQVEDSSGKDRFEGFEPKMGDSTHTATLEDPHQEEQPWDAFLEEVEDREPSAN